MEQSGRYAVLETSRTSSQRWTGAVRRTTVASRCVHAGSEWRRRSCVDAGLPLVCRYARTLLFPRPSQRLRVTGILGRRSKLMQAASVSLSRRSAILAHFKTFCALKITPFRRPFDTLRRLDPLVRLDLDTCHPHLSLHFDHRIRITLLVLACDAFLPPPVHPSCRLALRTLAAVKSAKCVVSLFMSLSLVSIYDHGFRLRS